MKSIFYRKTLIIALATFSLGASALVANATHSWGSYHWARTNNPFTLKLGDNVSSVWDSYLATASSDWNVSTVLHTTIVPGSTDSRRCNPKSGRVEVCGRTYGNNGWLGIASIWVSGTHITQGTVKVNDTYFNTATYNTPGWRRMVMCQEVAHTFGLDHQDTDFNNANLGTCMDYTSDPTGTAGTNGTLSNEHANQHDYDELGIIYSHLDSITSLGASTFSGGNNAHVNADDSSDLGKAIQKDSKGRTSFYEHDLGKGEKLFTFVLWAE